VIDSSVIALVKSRKNGAFKMLYESCIGYVYAIVRRYVSNESDHQDVIQEIFARLFLSIHTFDEKKGDFKFWLRRLVINQCMQNHRQGKSPSKLVSIDKVAEEETEVEEELEELSKAEIEDLLKSMPERYRQVFMLVIIDEYPHKEVGELLGISAETSRSQLSRAKNWIKQNISRKNLKTLINGR
jgi:RNA polymerase sigma factor (sigma-70 family)